MDENVVSKSNVRLKFFYRQVKNVNLKTKKRLVSALIQCHFDYASVSWYSVLTKRYKTRLQSTENKIIRFLLNAPARTHVEAHEFGLVRTLPVELRVKLLKLNLVHNTVHGNAPIYLSPSLNLTRNQHKIQYHVSPSVNIEY